MRPAKNNRRLAQGKSAIVGIAIICVLILRREDKEPTPSSRVCTCHFVGGLKVNGPMIFERNIKKRFDFPDLTPKRQ